MFKRLGTLATTNSKGFNKALFEKELTKAREAFKSGQKLYDDIMAAKVRNETIPDDKIKEALKLLDEGRGAPEAGGEMGLVRTYFIQLGNLLYEHKQHSQLKNNGS